MKLQIQVFQKHPQFKYPKYLRFTIISIRNNLVYIELVFWRELQITLNENNPLSFY